MVEQEREPRPAGPLVHSSNRLTWRPTRRPGAVRTTAAWLSPSRWANS